MSEHISPNWEADQPAKREQFSPPEIEPRQEILADYMQEFSSVINRYISDGRPHDSRLGIKLSGLFGRMMQEYVNKIPDVEKLTSQRTELAEPIQVKADLTDRLAFFYGRVHSLEKGQATNEAEKDLRGYMAEHITRTLFYRWDKTAPIYYPLKTDEDKGIDVFVDYRQNPDDAPDIYRDKVLAVQVKSLSLTEAGATQNRIVYPIKTVKQLELVLDELITPKTIDGKSTLINYGEAIMASMGKNIEYAGQFSDVVPVLVALPNNPEYGFGFPHSRKAAEKFGEGLIGEDT